MKSLSEPIARRANAEGKVTWRLRAIEPLMPLVGVRSFNLPDISAAEYVELVEFTGRD